MDRQSITPTRFNLIYRSRRKRLWGLFWLTFGLGIFLEAPSEPGRYVVVLMAVVSGLYLVGHVHRMQLNPLAGKLSRERGWLIPFTRESYPVSKIRGITLKHRLRSSSDAHSSDFPIHLSGIKDAVIAHPRDLYFARQLAEALAQALGKPLNNRVYRVSSLRQPDELDRSVMDRWCQGDKPPEPAVLPVDSRLVVEREPQAVAFYLPVNSLNLTVILAFSLLWLLLGSLIIGWAGVRDLGVLWVFSIGGLVCGYMLLHLIGRYRLRIDRQQVTLRMGWWPRLIRMPLDEVEEYIVASDSIVLVSDNAVISLDWTSHAQDNVYLETTIPHELLRFAALAEQVNLESNR